MTFTSHYKINLILLISSAFFCEVRSQEIQWASEVIEVSSEFKVKKDHQREYKAFQVLGAPSVMPSCGESYCAWTPTNLFDSIKVTYTQPMQINRVIINQNYNTGGIIRIVITDTDEKELIVYQQDNPTFSPKGETLNITFPLTKMPIYAVKLVLLKVNSKKYNQIDAIGIAHRDTDYIPMVKILPFVDEPPKVESLGKNINSEGSELSPVISPDGNTLFFTRSNPAQYTGDVPDQDVWFAEINENAVFSKARNIKKPVNNEDHNSTFSCNDERRLLLNNIYSEKSKTKKGVSVSYYNPTEQTWSFPEALKINDFHNYSKYSEFFLSADDKILIMTIEKEDSYGNKDVYVSFQSSDKVYSSPLNLGKIINTAASETSPFLSKDGKLLFFSSAGHPGFGSNDFFVSKRLDDTWTKWSEPINLGDFINTPRWDAYLSMPDSMDYIYFASYENALGESDIFRIKLSEDHKKQLFGE